MENASKALLMAGAVLIGTMIIALGVYLFTVFGGTGKEITDKMALAQVTEFNNKFTKFQGVKTCTIHDVVSISNLAKDNNQKYDYNFSERNSDPYYITVSVTFDGYTYNNFENESPARYELVLKTYSLKASTNEMRYFTCTKVETSDVTHLVKRITFVLNN